jgi:hypothetical protein
MRRLYMAHLSVPLFRQPAAMTDNSCMHPQGFNENSRLRASDADRDTAASVINNALAEGRLTADEHSDRLDAIYSARTQADLVPLLEDLPATAATAAPPAAQGQRGKSRRGGRIVAILGGASRKGAWHAEPVINVLTVLGGAELDFRDAILPGNEVVLRAVSILGGMEVIVPPEMNVIDNGIAILGGRDVAGPTAQSADQATPVLRIEGICLLGGLEVKRKARRGSSDSVGGSESTALPGSGFGYGLRELRDQRREMHRQIHDSRREMHNHLHQRRREMRWGSTDDTDE